MLPFYHTGPGMVLTKELVVNFQWSCILTSSVTEQTAFIATIINAISVASIYRHTDSIYDGRNKCCLFSHWANKNATWLVCRLVKRDSLCCGRLLQAGHRLCMCTPRTPSSTGFVTELSLWWLSNSSNLDRFASVCDIRRVFTSAIEMFNFVYTSAWWGLCWCVQHGAAVAAGFRNSGLSVSTRGKIVAVCRYYLIIWCFCCSKPWYW